MVKEKLIPVGVRIGKKSLQWARRTCLQEGLSFSQFIRRCVAREFMARQVKP